MMMRFKQCLLEKLHTGFQLQEGVHWSPGSSARHCQRVLEDDLGEEYPDTGHADTL